MYRAKRLSCRLSERASVLWGGGGGCSPGEDDEPPPPVPRHRTDPAAKYDTVVSDGNHVRLLDKRTRAYTCKELLCIVFIPCLVICVLGIVCSALVIHHVLGKVRDHALHAIHLVLPLCNLLSINNNCVHVASAGLTIIQAGSPVLWLDLMINIIVIHSMYYVLIRCPTYACTLSYRRDHYESRSKLKENI